MRWPNARVLKHSEETQAVDGLELHSTTFLARRQTMSHDAQTANFPFTHIEPKSIDIRKTTSLSVMRHAVDEKEDEKGPASVDVHPSHDGPVKFFYLWRRL